MALRFDSASSKPRPILKKKRNLQGHGNRITQIGALARVGNVSEGGLNVKAVPDPCLIIALKHRLFRASEMTRIEVSLGYADPAFFTGL